MLGALAQWEGHAIDNYIRTIMVPIVARHPADTAADTLGEPIILTGTKQVQVPCENILADRRHLGGRHILIDVKIFERAVEPGDVLLDPEGLAVKAPCHVENRVTAQKALVTERDHDVAVADDLAVEPGDALVAERHRSPLPTRRPARSAPRENS